MKRYLAPSLLSADFGRLDEEIGMVNRSSADWLHLDIMDGVFVPNISYGFPVIHQVKKHSRKPLDVHLMIIEPDRYLERFRQAGADVLTVHLEACTHLHRTLGAIKKLEMKAGVALNPHTPVHLLEDIIDDTDLVLIMSVNPGFGGQQFIEHSIEKIRKLRELIEKKNTDTLIEVDGGVDLSNAGLLYEAGADVLVAGNSVFSSPDPEEMIRKLKAAAVNPK